MAKADVLDRVAADLARGHTQPAIQRLASLVAAHPTDLDLRRRLAAVYRIVGNPIEAGRWSYLNADADPAEVAAFERAYPSPEHRLHRLHWPTQDGYAATEFARTRLAELSATARTPAAAVIPERSAQRRRSAQPLGVPTSVGSPRSVRLLWSVGLPCLVAGLASIPFAVIGGVTVVQWLVR
jgi:hypothetical protein